jgi:8-amino-3,8-dideoxy-alpha-D-manno-octulosonate transaminase
MPGYELIGAEEFEEVKSVFDCGGILFRHGFESLRNNCFKVREFEQKFASNFGVKHALAVTSGTAALRVALAALDIGHGDEVITQSFTFVATVEAIIEAGAIPVCTEIDATLNIDPDSLQKKISSRTKAVIVVHMLGMPARMVEIVEICRQQNIKIIEDTAWGCGGYLQNLPLGTWGDIGTFSFDFAKTITTGEGGMLLFREESIWKKASAWHDHGHENNPSVPRWEDSRSSSGFNFRMMELQGAVGLAQLKKLSTIVNTQRRNRDLLYKEIIDLPGLEFRAAPVGAYDTADALIFLVLTNKIALRCREELLKVGLSTKILPEAYSWHFAGNWTHMPELVLAHDNDLVNAFPKSREILSRAVSIPVSVKMDKGMPARLRSALEKAIQ